MQEVEVDEPASDVLLMNDVIQLRANDSEYIETGRSRSLESFVHLADGALKAQVLGAACRYLSEHGCADDAGGVHN